MKCDFCLTNESIGVYATDHGPFSLCYCEECLKHNNLRTLYNALSKYARFGNIVFDELKELNGCEPQVYFKNKYITLRELIDIITIDDVNDYFRHQNYIEELIVNKLKEKSKLS